MSDNERRPKASENAERNALIVQVTELLQRLEEVEAVRIGELDAPKAPAEDPPSQDTPTKDAR